MIHDYFLKDISDLAERKVMAALADPQWDFRTVNGIAKATQLSQDQVVQILKKYEGALVRQSSVPDERGRELFTLAIGTGRKRSIFNLLRTFITKSVQG